MEKLKKPDIIAGIAQKLPEGTSIKQVEAIYAATFGFIKEQMVQGNAVPVFGFGTFASKERAATTSKNPRTGEKVDVPARTVPTFKPAVSLKAAVNHEVVSE